MRKTISEYLKEFSMNVNKQTWYFNNGSNFEKALNNIKNLKRNVVIWGASKGGEKVLKLARKHGIKVKSFVDKDPNKWGKEINKIKIIEPDKVSKESFILIGSVYEKEIVCDIKRKGFRFYLGGLLTNMKFNIEGDKLIRKEQFIESVLNILSDEDSKKTYLSMYLYAIDNDASRISATEYNQYFHPLVKPEENDIIVDGGAYTGDTVDLIMSKLRGKVKIYAFEPEKNNFAILKRISEQYGDRVTAIRKGLWSSEGKQGFITEQEDAMGHHISIKNCNEFIETTSIDIFFKTKKAPTLIKMDIEGAELEAIHGAERVIKEYKPKLQICLYHRADHFYEIPLVLKKWIPEYKMFIGHHSSCWDDTVLYCTIR